MNIWFTIEFSLLAFLSTWMTATAIMVLRGRRQREEEMKNLYEQVIGALQTGDLPRAILILEGEPGPLASILSSVLTEATKFNPKLRVAYKVTIESLRRRSQIQTNPLRIIPPFAIIFGILGLLVALIIGDSQAWTIAFLMLIIVLVISIISFLVRISTERQSRENLIAAGDLGKSMLDFLLSPESPLRRLRGQAFPPLQ